MSKFGPHFFSMQKCQVTRSQKENLQNIILGIVGTKVRHVDNKIMLPLLSYVPHVNKPIIAFPDLTKSIIYFFSTLYAVQNFHILFFKYQITSM